MKKCLAITLVLAGVLGLGVGGYHGLLGREAQAQTESATAPAQKQTEEELSAEGLWKLPAWHLSLAEAAAWALESLKDEVDETGLIGRHDACRILTCNPRSGIVVARLTSELSAAEFQRYVNNVLLNTELAYWKLYQAYGDLYSYERALAEATKTWQVFQVESMVGRPKRSRDVSGRAPYEDLRDNCAKARAQVLEAERQLRGILGIVTQDGKRLVPITAPIRERRQLDWKTAQDDAIALRPELILARREAERARLELIGREPPAPIQYARFPAVSLNAIPDTVRLIQLPSAGNASLPVQTTVSRWRPSFPLHYPQKSPYRVQYEKAQSAVMNSEERAILILALHYQRSDEWYRRIESTRAEQEACSKSLESYRNVSEQTAGKGDACLAGVLLGLLQYQRSVAVSRIKHYESIAEYNMTLARWDWARGRSTQRHNVTVREGLPDGPRTSATQNEIARVRALMQKLVPTPLAQPAMLVGSRGLSKLSTD